MIGEEVDFKKFCEGCLQLEMSEAEQNSFYKLHKYKPDHRCKKYNVRVFHSDMHPKLLRCRVCLDEDGFESKTVGV